MIEPNADIRTLAATMMQMFVALTQAGFTPEQSFDMVKSVMVAGFSQSGNK